MPIRSHDHEPKPWLCNRASNRRDWVVGMSGSTQPLTITVITEKDFQPRNRHDLIGRMDKRRSGDSNLRNVSVSINDYPDTT